MTPPEKTKRILLISNSTLYGSGYLDHAAGEICDFLGKIERVLFVPFALHAQDSYAAKTRARFNAMGYDLDSAHEVPDKKQAVKDAKAIFIGGGNTFRLLKALYDFELLSLVRQRVEAGMPYIGSSAGSNVAGPTIKTTNDMPIIEPPSFNALRLVSFQINPHSLDPVPGSTHMGETREERILQFLEENDTPVAGLREGSMVRVEKGSTILKGSTGARIFRKGQLPIEVEPGAKLDELVAPIPRK
jgi:dipeptidase E